MSDIENARKALKTIITGMPQYEWIIDDISNHFQQLSTENERLNIALNTSKVNVKLKDTTIITLQSQLATAIAERDEMRKDKATLSTKLAVFNESLEMISKICKSKKHKDPINDILTECNRAKRLASEL